MERKVLVQKKDIKSNYLLHTIQKFFFSDRERQVTMSNTEDIELMRTFTWPKVTLENVPKNVEAPIFKSRKRTRAHVALFKARDIFCKF